MARSASGYLERRDVTQLGVWRRKTDVGGLEVETAHRTQPVTDLAVFWIGCAAIGGGDAGKAGRSNQRPLAIRIIIGSMP